MYRKPISLLGSIKRLDKVAKNPSKTPKVAIEFRTPDGDLLFNPDEQPLAREFAKALAETVKENLLAGLAPDGSSMPGIAPSTEEQRERLEEQGQRGGYPANIKDPKLRAQAKKRFDDQFTAKRLGSFTPKAGGPRGVLSGMLAASFSARPRKDGTGFIVYVAAKRGKPDRGDISSALERVFEGVALGPNVMNQPKVRAAAERAAARLFGDAMSRISDEAKEALERLQDLAEQAQEDPDE